MRKPYQVRDFTPRRRPFGRYGAHGCIHCGRPATKEALFKNGGFIIVEKYCDSCLQTEKFTAIMTFYAMTVG